MDSLQQSLHTLYVISLDQLIQNFNATTEEVLWAVPEGGANSCGVLAQHLIGNINHYIGQGIGDTGYVRRRDHEFSTTGSSREEWIQAVEDLKQTLDVFFMNLTGMNLSKISPWKYRTGPPKEELWYIFTAS